MEVFPPVVPVRRARGVPEQLRPFPPRLHLVHLDFSCAPILSRCRDRGEAGRGNGEEPVEARVEPSLCHRKVSHEARACWTSGGHVYVDVSGHEGGPWVSVEIGSSVPVNVTHPSPFTRPGRAIPVGLGARP